MNTHIIQNWEPGVPAVDDGLFQSFILKKMFFSYFRFTFRQLYNKYYKIKCVTTELRSIYVKFTQNQNKIYYIILSVLSRKLLTNMITFLGLMEVKFEYFQISNYFKSTILDVLLRRGQSYNPQNLSKPLCVC